MEGENIMIIKFDGNKIAEVNDKYIRCNPYETAKGINGANYVKKESVTSDILHVSEGNSKTGEKCINFNFPIEYTCKHDCECYTKKICYAESGCYLFADNQANYSENYNFYKTVSKEQFVKAIQIAIDKFNFNLFRYFTCGDIPDIEFIDCMVKIAENNPGMKFWSYTKKYGLVNLYLMNHAEGLPENLTIIFSHWLNSDGTYYPMPNPFNLPTSEFIPLGMEKLAEQVTHICPCSDPSVVATCATCEHACYTLKTGESMALLEHSTKQTKDRDKSIKAAKQAIKNK